ncbi:MAG: hypothetical protein ABJP82_16945 [Hyphomicrobiales bacterium]
MMSPALAVPAKIVVSNEDGFGRMILTFEGENLVPAFSSSSNNNVLVLAFQDAIESNIDGVAVTLRDYVGVARRDPDGRGLRFSLSRGTRVNVQEAGEKLFVDFLPAGWVGLAPSLPEDVVRALAERAEKAFKAARAAEEAGRPGKLRPRAELQVGRHPTFTRFSFGWNISYNAAFVRDGQSVAISFDSYAPLDLSALEANLPPGLDHVEALKIDDNLNVILTVSDEANIRAFRDGDVYIVDMTVPREESGSVISGLDDAGRPTTALLGSDVLTDNPPTPPNASQVTEAQGKVTQNTSQISLLDAAQADESANPQQRLAEIVQDSSSYQETAVPLAEPTPMAERPETPPRPVPEANAPLVSDDDRTMLLVDARVTEGNAAFTFQYNEEVAAALFRRERALWMIFDSTLPMELSLAKSVAQTLDANLTKISLRGATVIRLDLPRPMFASLTKRSSNWVVSVGDTIFQPGKPLELTPVVDEQGRAQIKANLQTVGTVHKIFDERAGDLIFVATSKARSQGLLREQQFAELNFFPSAHGLAGTSLVDDLKISAAQDFVLVSREGGLSLSSKAQSSGFKLSPATLGEEDGDKKTTSLAALLHDAHSDPGKKFRDAADAIARRVAFAKPADRPMQRMQAARFYLANRMPHEALGMTKLAIDEAPALESDTNMLLLRSAAFTMAQRPKEAMRVLGNPRLADNSDAAFWASISASDMQDWESSYGNLRRGHTVLGAYPVAVQHRFLLSGAKASLEYSDRAYSDTLLSEINPSTLTPRHLADYLVLRGRIAKEAGDEEQALRSWAQARALGQRPEAAEADFLTLEYKGSAGTIEKDELIRELSGLSLRWRGDEIELKSLRLLSQLYAEDSRFRESFQSMKTAVLVDRGADTTRSLQDEISRRFEDLFLHGGASALDPVEALALYYDFRELTPIGAKGDEMVRKLASRLIDVDLLSQATELLAHQVDNRLRGTARAQIAADLAFVHILNREPHLALQAIRRTQQAQLPNLLDRQRRLLEAKALADTGKPDLAVTLVRNLLGTDAERLVADIQWDSEKWQDSAESYERVAGESWADDAPLSASQRLDVLKAGIAYSLARDKLGLQRLRSKFAEKMGESEDASAFDVVTGPLEKQGFAFRSLSRRLTEADTMRTFLADYRRRYIAPADVATSSLPEAEAAVDATEQNEDGLAVDGNAA